jgi:protein-disulfide isomerase
MKLFHLFSSHTASATRRMVLLAGLRRIAASLALALLVLPAAQGQAQAPLKPDVPLDELMKTGELPDNVMGKDDAPYTIIEYSSMTCPHCAQFHKNVLPELKTKYIDTGKARYIVREFPLDNVAAAAFMLARCVDQSKYFDFIDLLYVNQEEWAFSGNPLPGLQKFSKQVGFTEEKFDQCLKDEKLLTHIEWVRNRANTEFEVRATPTFFVNGQRLKGGSIEDFDNLLGGTDGKS